MMMHGQYNQQQHTHLKYGLTYILPRPFETRGKSESRIVWWAHARGPCVTIQAQPERGGARNERY